MKLDMLDKSRAPKGKYLGSFEILTGPVRTLYESGWMEIKQKLGEEVLKQWQVYTTNVRRDNMIACCIYIALEISKEGQQHAGWRPYMGDGLAFQQCRFRPIPGLSGYRMPVKHLYLASSAASGPGGVKGASGYICYKVIAQDFGLRKIWTEKGRSY